jgi:uncharacterized membrane protein YkvA (DUF1232 family)
VEAFFVFLKVAIIGSFALIALVLVLLAIPQSRLKSTLSELLAWCGCLGASGLIASPVDLIPDMLPVIGWTDDLGYALLALVCGSIGWKQRRRRLTRPASRQAIPLALPHTKGGRSAQCATRGALGSWATLCGGGTRAGTREDAGGRLPEPCG